MGVNKGSSMRNLSRSKFMEGRTLLIEEWVKSTKLWVLFGKIIYELTTIDNIFKSTWEKFATKCCIPHYYGVINYMRPKYSRVAHTVIHHYILDIGLRQPKNSHVTSSPSISFYILGPIQLNTLIIFIIYR